jgi:uncharacterized membrane protein YcjF (UPF0283 family)
MTEEEDYRPSSNRTFLKTATISIEECEMDSVDEGEFRGGDTNHNRPPQKKPITTIITAEQLQAETEKQREVEFERELAQHFLRLPKIVSTPLAWICLLLAMTLSVLFVLGQTATTWTAISNMPGWAKWPCISVLLILSVMIFYSVVRLLVIYRKLKVNQQIPLRDLHRLEERFHLRALAQARKAEGVKQLKDFLNSYPLAEKSDQLQLKKLKSAGLTDDDLRILQAAKIKLLNPDLHPGTSGWMNDFTSEFQGILDAAARRMVNDKARMVGFKTAASPYPLLDFMVVLSANFQILTSLLIIYQLRMGTISTCITLTQILLNSLFSAQLDELEEMAGEELSHFMGDSMLSVITARFSTKAAKGAFNYLLLKRLSRRTMRMLQPVAIQT